MPIYKASVYRLCGVACAVADDEKKAREIIEGGMEVDYDDLDDYGTIVQDVEDVTGEFNKEDAAEKGYDIAVTILVEKQREQLEKHNRLDLMPREAQKRVSLLARVTIDGYLLGCTDDFEHGWSEKFWSDYHEEGAFQPETVLIEVPESMKEGLLTMGTMEQSYSDGYQAWQDVLSVGGYKGKE